MKSGVKRIVEVIPRKIDKCMCKSSTVEYCCLMNKINNYNQIYEQIMKNYSFKMYSLKNDKKIIYEWL